jgi:hypothetical protein
VAEPKFLRALLALLWIAVAVVVAYWVVWFFIDRSALASLDTPSYFAFESSFPLADGWLAVTWAASAALLGARRPSAMFWLLASGSASLYLGFMDILFDLENGVYRASDTGAVATEIVINVSSLGIGVWTLWFGWAHRKWFMELRVGGGEQKPR